ncbi:MAG: ROK family protein [Candidatus Omnitrophica bacterium]|nr:ROK family protein [Candidatus Omnitrophota bacterium]
MSYLIGVDIGGTKTSVSLGNFRGKVLIRRVFPSEGVKATLSQIKRIIRAYLARYDRDLKRTKGIGVSCPGPLDFKKGLLITSPNMPTWRNVPLKRIFSRSFTLPVAVDNDANCAALAEKTFGAGKGVNSLFYYTVSTGIGGGLIINGEIFHGASNDAGEIGHSVVLPEGPKCNCGKRGCLEALASGTAIARIARERARRNSLILKLAGKRKDINAGIVAQAALKGDKLARAIYEQAAFYLGLSITNVIQIINPEMIVIGGGVAKAGPILFRPLVKTVRAYTWPRPYRSCKIVPAKLKDAVGDLGAISLLLKGFHLGAV